MAALVGGPGSSRARNKDATVYVGGLDEKVDEALLWELFTQAGPVADVSLPKDDLANATHRGYGFVEFRSEDDAEYAVKIMRMIKLYGKSIKVNKSAAGQEGFQQEIGANLFLGHLSPEVDEKLLYDTFSAFGTIVRDPKIMRDVDTGESKGFGFVAFDSFEASDRAIQCECQAAFGVVHSCRTRALIDRLPSLSARSLWMSLLPSSAVIFFAISPIISWDLRFARRFARRLAPRRLAPEGSCS